MDNIRIPKDAQGTLDTLRSTGVKFNIVNVVESDGPVKTRTIELYYSYRRLNGKEFVHHVADLNAYGHFTEYGPYFDRDKPPKDYVLNADGEKIPLSSIKE